MTCAYFNKKMSMITHQILLMVCYVMLFIELACIYLAHCLVFQFEKL